LLKHYLPKNNLAFYRNSVTFMLFSCRTAGVFDSGVTINELNAPLNDTSIRRVTWVAADDELQSCVKFK